MHRDNSALTHSSSIPHNPMQHKIAIAVALCWIVYLICLLTAQETPEPGRWANPPHLTSSILLALALSAALSPFFSANTPLGWWTLVISTLFIIGFECLQLLTPDRSFQFLDIAQGISGAAIAAMSASLLSTVIGRSAYVWLALAVAVVVLIGSLALLRVDEPESEVSCAESSIITTNWDYVVLNVSDSLQSNNKLVYTSVGTLCVFDNNGNQTVAVANQTAESGPPALQMTGGGLISGDLTGLRKALSNSGQLTFGVRFKTDELQAGRPPRFLASLQTTDAGLSQNIARVVQNGPNTSAAFSFQPWQGSSTAIANRLKDQYHEVILTYDGKVQTTYFDGQPVGTETTSIGPIDASGGELVINIGKRADRRWKPFIGEISAIIIGSRSLTAKEIPDVFER